MSEEDMVSELRTHIREVAGDRDKILSRNSELESWNKRARAWISSHGRHPHVCEGEGKCQCGLDELRSR